MNPMQMNPIKNPRKNKFAGKKDLNGERDV